MHEWRRRLGGIEANRQRLLIVPEKRAEILQRRDPRLPRDYGSVRLRAKKRVATGREDVEMTPAGVLYGHGHLDNMQYSARGWVTELLQQIARSFGHSANPAGLWFAILGALTKTTPGIEKIVGDQGSRRVLEQVCRRLDGSRDLVLELAAEGALPPICAWQIVSPTSGLMCTRNGSSWR